MKSIYLLAAASLIFISAFYYFIKEEQPPDKKVIEKFQDDVSELYNEVLVLNSFIKEEKPLPVIQEQFKISRDAYKRTEWLAEYYNSYTAKQINGPAVPEVEADEKSIIINPEGFQVIEALLFPAFDKSKKTDLQEQVALLLSTVNRLSIQARSLETTDAHIFDALRLELFRIISLGISGFDSPLAKNSIREANAALSGVQSYFHFYRPLLKKKNNDIDAKCNRLFEAAIKYLSRDSVSSSFNSAVFIKDYANPLSEYLLVAERQLSIPLFNEPRPLLASAPTLFTEDIFNANFYAPTSDETINQEKISLGKMLFNDVILSGNEKISCASCHQPQRAFTDGLKTSLSISGSGHLKRNSPTLINAALQPALFYDARVAFLEDQAKEVILNKEEMHGSFEIVLVKLNKVPKYKMAFASIFHGNEITSWQIRNVLASYLRSLVSLNSPFDKYMRGDSRALTKNEIDGFNLFMGKGRCGTCHFIPLFNGTAPPNFSKSEAEVIGVPSASDTIKASLDADFGKYNLYKIPLQKNAFKTPTLRNIALTAPYMHNGVYKTLEEVIGFYNRGGGGGLGIEIPNLTLPEDKLQLSDQEQKAIVSFLRALTDTSSIAK